MIEIKNLPPYHERYVVTHPVKVLEAKQKDIHVDYWYWGSWPEEKDAYDAARRIGGQVFDRPDEDTFEEDSLIDDAYADAINAVETLHDIAKGKA